MTSALIRDPDQFPADSLIEANADGARLKVDRDALARALAVLPLGAPIVVMIHGYSFAPDVAGCSPHQHILSLTPPDCPDPKAISWPRHLRIGRDPSQGLAIAFGWQARGTIWAAYARAARTARALARLIRLIRELAPGQQVQIIGHSLGARVALQALPLLEAGAVGRLILMAAAEFARPAIAAMDCPAGRQAQVINVTSRENDIFDFLIEWALKLGTATAIGQGLPKALPNWLDLQLDQRATLDALRGAGFRLKPQSLRVCHWSPYLRPGVFALYRALLGGALTPAALRAILPARRDARWSRLIALPEPTMRATPS